MAVAARIRSWLLACSPSFRLSDLPNIDPNCAERVCQIRFTRAAQHDPHDLYGEIMQDVVLDANGSFWCAQRAGRQSDQPNTLQVVQGRLRVRSFSGSSGTKWNT